MPGELIPLAAIVLGIGVAFWSIYWDHQRKRLQYQERQLMIEKGLTPPPMLPEEPKRRAPEDSLRRGLVMFCLGVGLGVASVVSAGQVEEKLGAVLGVAAAIVGFVGVGHLAYYFIARRKPEDKTSAL